MRTKACIIICAILCSLLSACSKENANGAPLAVNLTDEWVQGVGYIEPASEVRRLAFKHPGVIAECLVDVGQQVKKGELLMRLSDTEERAAVAKAEAMVALAKTELAQTLAGVNPARIRSQTATLEAAKAEAEYAKKNFQRQQNLLTNNGAASQSDRDLAEMEMQRKVALVSQAQAELENLVNYVRPEDHAVLDAKVHQAEAQLTEARANAEQMELRAPFDGTVLEVLQREGNSAFSAFPEPVLVFADVSKLRVRAEIDETCALRLKEGQAASVCTRDEGRKESAGHVQVVKNVMGKKTVFSKTSTERKDLDVLQVLIDLPVGTNLPVGLEVDVRVNTGVVESHAAKLPRP